MKSLKNFLKKRYPESYKTDKNTIIRGLGENPLTMLNRTVFTFDYVTSANRAFLRVETKKIHFIPDRYMQRITPQYLNKIQVFYQDEEN